MSLANNRVIYFSAALSILFCSATNAEAASSKESAKTQASVLIGRKEPANGWTRLNHKVYRVDYPSCMTLNAGIDEDNDVTKSPTVAFFRSTCNGKSGLQDDFDANLSDNFRGTPLTRIWIENAVDDRMIKSNGRDARLFTRTGTRDGKPSIWWTLFIQCGRDVASLTYGATIGEESKKRIEKKEYSLPNEFREVAASFQCTSSSQK